MARYSTGSGHYGGGSSSGGHYGSKLNKCARKPRSARGKAVRSRTTKAAKHSRPMEYTYREVPFGTPRANIKGL